MNCMNLGTLRMLIVGCGLFLSAMIQAQRSEFLLEKNWKFTKGDVTGAVSPEFDDSKWETVSVPHDWAIFGPFDRNNDLQNVAILRRRHPLRQGVPADCRTWALAGIVRNSMFLPANR